MVSATLDRTFWLPLAKPIEKPVVFTAAQLQRLIGWGNARTRDCCPTLRRTLSRIEQLRHNSVTWAIGLSLGDLMTWSAKAAQGSTPSLSAPLTFFKPEGLLWIPKVIIRTSSEFQIDPEELRAYHTTCRHASIEFLSIMDEHIDHGYLDRKDFKRAFNGAFFCDRRRNTTIFCPTLRDWGFHAWTN
jgi:hypothetical protein